nr:hypothetical protein [Deltaproteobacteria bacterium]
MTFLAGATLALLCIPACGARGNTTIIPETDSGSPPVDSGSPPVDTGSPPVDTGSPPVDVGLSPVDVGTPPVDVGSPPVCASPRMVCDGVCVDVRTDIAHCGACSRACATGQFCSAGACRSTSECTAPRMTCGSSCIDITTDVFNCGACSRRCGDGQTCVGSRCVGGTPTCPAPTMLCGARCINVSSDPANCGACGRACASGTTCSSGSCVAIAVGIAASGPCESEACGPTGELLCRRAYTSGGFCTGFCSTDDRHGAGPVRRRGEHLRGVPALRGRPRGPGLVPPRLQPRGDQRGQRRLPLGPGVHGLLGLHPGVQRAGHPRVLPSLRDRRALRRSGRRRREPDALQHPHGPLLSLPGGPLAALRRRPVRPLGRHGHRSPGLPGGVLPHRHHPHARPLRQLPQPRRQHQLPRQPRAHPAGRSEQRQRGHLRVQELRAQQRVRLPDAVRVPRVGRDDPHRRGLALRLPHRATALRHPLILLACGAAPAARR